MLRLYSMFPPGRAGVALLLMRVSIAVALLTSAFAHIGSRGGLAATCVVTLTLSIGFATPVCAGICCILQLVFLWRFADAIATCLVLGPCISIALSMLGPGAYSVDARIFGRRRVMLVDGER